MAGKKRFESNSKYFTIAVYSVISVLIIAIIVRAIFFWDATSSLIGNLLSTLTPFWLGIIFAFLISPLVNLIRKLLFERLLHLKNFTLVKLLSILIAYCVVVAVIILGLLYIIPEIISSLTQLLNRIPEWGAALTSGINTLSERYPDFDFQYLRDTIVSTDSGLQSAISGLIQSMTGTIVTTGVSIVRLLFNIIVAIIVSCYLLIDKRVQSRGLKRIVYAFFKKEHADRISHIVKRAIAIFRNFFDGKMLDSLIVGLICFICMLILGLFNLPGFSSCALLVSIIICVTNMIPYFGPFLGGIPSALLLCIYSPKSALIFIILIIVLQQIDGNIIGPRILGTSTGLRPLWIIFAITIGGWAAGVIGMFLGVPCVAVITGLFEEIVDDRLEKKGIDMPVIHNEKVRNKKPKDKDILNQAEDNSNQTEDNLDQAEDNSNQAEDNSNQTDDTLD